MQYAPSCYACYALSGRKYSFLDTYVTPRHPVLENINKYYAISQKRLSLQTLALTLFNSFLGTIPVILAVL